jgi:hypothetical protein
MNEARIPHQGPIAEHPEIIRFIAQQGRATIYSDRHAAIIVQNSETVAKKLVWQYPRSPVCR